MNQTRIFRQAALERLSTPERLDRMVVVTPPRTWVALLTLAALAAAVVAWSVRGEVATYVTGSGILLGSGGTVVDAVASRYGTLTRIGPMVGDAVEKGSVVAEVLNQEAVEQHRNALALVDERERAVEVYKATTADEEAVVARHVARQRERLERLERGGRAALDDARERLANHRSLFDERVITRAALERSQETVYRAERQLYDTMHAFEELESRELQRRNRYKARLAELRSQVQAAQRRASELNTVLGSQNIVSPVSGRVTEIKAAVGAVLRAGEAVLSVKSGSESIDGLIYIPPADGKRVERGMEALVSPSTVRREEHGAIRAHVASVSAFPVSPRGMVAVLQNRNLVESFSRDGAPYSGRVVLQTDPSTASGFVWTSPKGSDVTLSSGTLIEVEIKVASQTPISLVIPLLRELLSR